MKPLRIVDPAELEFREATKWYRERDPRVAGRFAAEARKTLRLIEQFPRIGGSVPGVDDRDVRRMPIHSFPYSLSVYSEEASVRNSDYVVKAPML